jgi:hypothetical protein
LLAFWPEPKHFLFVNIFYSLKYINIKYNKKYFLIKLVFSQILIFFKILKKIKVSLPTYWFGHTNSPPGLLYIPVYICTCINLVDCLHVPKSFIWMLNIKVVG